MCIVFIGSAFIDPETYPRVCYQISVGRIQTRHTYFLPRRFVEVHGKDSGLFYFTCCHQYIHWIQGSSLNLTISGVLLEIDI